VDELSGEVLPETVCVWFPLASVWYEPGPCVWFPTVSVVPEVEAECEWTGRCVIKSWNVCAPPVAAIFVPSNPAPATVMSAASDPPMSPRPMTALSLTFGTLKVVDPLPFPCGNIRSETPALVEVAAALSVNVVAVIAVTVAPTGTPVPSIFAPIKPRFRRSSLRLSIVVVV